MNKTTIIEFVHNEDAEKTKIEERRILEVYITYTKGRGYSLHVQPVKRSTSESGLTLREYIPTDGIQRLLERPAKFSQKRFDEIAKNLNPQNYLEMIEQLKINLEQYKTLDK